MQPLRVEYLLVAAGRRGDDDLNAEGADCSWIVGFPRRSGVSNANAESQPLAM